MVVIKKDKNDIYKDDLIMPPSQTVLLVNLHKHK